MGDDALDVGMLAACRGRARPLVVTPFFRDALVAIAPPEWKGRRPRAVDAATVAAHPLILFEAGATLRRVIDGWFHRAGVAPRAPMELGNTEAIKKLVEAWALAAR